MCESASQSSPVASGELMLQKLAEKPEGVFRQAQKPKGLWIDSYIVDVPFAHQQIDAGDGQHDGEKNHRGGGGIGGVAAGTAV